MKRYIVVLVVALVALNLGCGTMNSLQPSWAPVNVKSLDVSAPTLMVASQVETPLYLVVDTEQVPNELQIATTNNQQMNMYNIRAYVSDHLRVAMENYFERVEVIGADQPMPEEAHIVGHVQVSEVGMTLLGHSAYGDISWSFALQPQAHDEFIFSYAGRSRGDFGLTHVSQTSPMYRATFGAAIGDMLESYVDKDVHAELRRWEQDRGQDVADDRDDTTAL